MTEGISGGKVVVELHYLNVSLRKTGCSFRNSHNSFYSLAYNILMAPDGF